MPEVAAQLDMEFAVVTDCPPPPNPKWREGTAKRRLYDLLAAWYPQWCPVNEIQRITAKYTQRFNNAGEMNDYFRPLGWEIVNDQDKALNLSWYRFKRIRP